VQQQQQHQQQSAWCGVVWWSVRGACNQLATAGQFVIATQSPAAAAAAAGWICGSAPPARTPALIHSKCIDRREKVGKVRDSGDKWQTA